MWLEMLEQALKTGFQQCFGRVGFVGKSVGRTTHFGGAPQTPKVCTPDSQCLELCRWSVVGGRCLTHLGIATNKIPPPDQSNALILIARSARVGTPLFVRLSDDVVSQVINVTNAMQGTKTLMMKLKIQFRRGTANIAEVAQVAQFPPGF